jgi:hypothetical protein
MGHPPRLISKGLRPHSIPFELQASTQNRAAKSIFRIVSHAGAPQPHIKLRFTVKSDLQVSVKVMLRPPKI